MFERTWKHNAREETNLLLNLCDNSHFDQNMNAWSSIFYCLPKFLKAVGVSHLFSMVFQPYTMICKFAIILLFRSDFAIFEEKVITIIAVTALQNSLLTDSERDYFLTIPLCNVHKIDLEWRVV